MASSSRSPGMNVETDRRTNAVFVARSRSQALVDIARRTFRAIPMLRGGGPFQAAEWSEQTLDHAAVDLDRGAGDIRRSVGQQERADAPELVGIAVTAERHGAR